MKKVSYSLFGLIVGATLGAMLGSGQLFKRTITKQEMHTDIASWRWTILGAVCGAAIMGYWGAKVDRAERTKRAEETIAKQHKHTIRQALGLQPYPTSDIHMAGQSWVAVTQWSDPRNGRNYTLKTHKNASGQLVTSLAGMTFVHEASTSAEEEAVTSAHRKTRVMVFDTLVAAYENNNRTTVEEVLVNIDLQSHAK